MCSCISGAIDGSSVLPVRLCTRRFSVKCRGCMQQEIVLVAHRSFLCFLSLQQVGHGIWALALLKLLPVPVSKFLVSTGLIRRLSSFFQMAPRSLTEVVNELTDNKDLRAVFSYIFGTYGTSAGCRPPTVLLLLLLIELSSFSLPKSPLCRQHAQRC